LKTLSSPRGLRWGASLLLLVLPGIPAHARAHHGETWARDRFATAERMREALNGRLPADRTRHDYQRVINAYRAVYFGAPASTKADPSVVAVAETLVEMGRRFDDEKILNNAITQYKFLRREYPGSKYRFDALFTIGEVYKDDLNDPDEARSTFEEFLHRYPNNRLAEDAQQAIVALDLQAASEKKAAKKEDSGKKKSAKDAGSSDKFAPATHDQEESAKAPSGKTPRVTGIRHWSTPDYTRIAIDLESDVKFASQRIAHPDRIFFDLRGTRLASTLVGKSFDVDDGFLKKIRVAQFQPGRTRVVLEVDDLSDYEAFLIPNPYRLIIDIHGKNARGKLPKAPAAAPADADIEAARKENSKPGPKSDPEVAAAQLQSEIRAEAGKAPVASMDVNDETEIAANDGTTVTKSSSPSAGRFASGKKAPEPPVKKVVDAEDEDSSPTQLARLDTRPDTGLDAANESTLTPASRKGTGDESNPNSDAKDVKVSATRHTVVSRSRRKPSSAGQKSSAAGDLEVREARPTARGDRSLIRALGLKIGKIVIDPGHGGHDTGTIGPNGLEEKDLVLEVGRRLGKLLETRLGAEVVYTRKDDTFIPLETRTAIANQERADLFVSIHANSSRDPDARGVETYYLNFTSSPEALEVAARENAVSEKSIYELQDLVKKIALKEKIEESREFAGNVQQFLHSGLAAKSPAIRNRGVKKAPFIVLIGANMPSILAEISFVSNPTDERRLETSDYRQRVAESLYRGIAKYVNGLSGVKVASKLEKAAVGQ
jgi:N-acetylmuramoyl-L-alanine amidase